MAKEKNVEIGSAFDLLGKSWEIVKANWQAFLFVNILAIISSFDYGSDDVDNAGYQFNPDFVTGGAVLFFFILYIYFVFMGVVLQTRAVKGEKPEIMELVKAGANKFLPLFGLGVVSIVIAAVSFLLLIIPFIFVLPRLVMAPYIMVDKNLGVMDSLSESFKLGKAFFGKIWGAIGVMILVAIGSGLLGIFPVIGMLAGTLLAIAFGLVIPLRYQQIKNLKVSVAEK
jgi:hypothetical protein